MGQVQDPHLEALQKAGSIDATRPEGRIPPRQTGGLAEIREPELIEAEYEEINAEEDEKAAKRSKHQELQL